MNTNIPTTIFEEKAKTDIRNAIAKYASDNNISVDKLCNVLTSVLLDFEKQKSEYYSKVICSLIDDFSQTFESNIEQLKGTGVEVKEVNLNESKESISTD